MPQKRRKIQKLSFSGHKICTDHIQEPSTSGGITDTNAVYLLDSFETTLQFKKDYSEKC
jgi:hypothetical protein